MTWLDRLPVIIAVGQRTWRDQDVTRTPVDALHQVASVALDNANTDGLFEPINTYPLFENALSQQLGWSAAKHTDAISQLCSRMSAVASENRYAWRPQAMSPEDIAAVTPKNRYIGYPYTHAMNPVLAVDTAAALVMTTAGKAQEDCRSLAGLEIITPCTQSLKWLKNCAQVVGATAWSPPMDCI